MAERSPYEDTSVTVRRSQDTIRAALLGAGADAVRFGGGPTSMGWEMLTGQEQADMLPCRVEFVWPIGGGRQLVRIEIRPIEPSGRFTEAQRERQAWRYIAWYLDSTLKAAAAGLQKLEELLLPFIVIDGHDGPTVGEILVPRVMANQRLQIAAPKAGA